MNLSELKIGESARIVSVGGEGALRQHFLDMGVIPGVEMTLVKFAPMGDPIEFRIHDYELTLRLDDAKNILVTDPYKTEAEDKSLLRGDRKYIEHPGFGEGGRYHDMTH